MAAAGQLLRNLHVQSFFTTLTQNTSTVYSILKHLKLTTCETGIEVVSSRQLLLLKSKLLATHYLYSKFRLQT